MRVKKLLLVLTSLLIILISGCSPSPPNVTTLPLTLKILEPISYSFDINNPSQFLVTKEFSNLSVQFGTSDQYVIDNSKIMIDKTTIKDSEKATVKLSITSLAVGTFIINGNVNYKLNEIDQSLPLKISVNTLQVGNENLMTLELKERNLFINPSTDFGKPKTLHIIIKKEKDDKYARGKIKIVSESYSKLDCVSGWKCNEEKENGLEIFTEISKNLEVPFQITINKPGSQTDSVSFTPTMELFYSKDGASNWGKLSSNSFKVSSS